MPQDLEKARESARKRRAKAKIAKDIDRLGELKAQIADLTNEVDDIRAELISAGVEEADGRLFHVKISSFTVELVNWRGIVEFLKPDKRLIKKHTSKSERQRLTVSARH